MRNTRVKILWNLKRQSVLSFKRSLSSTIPALESTAYLQGIGKKRRCVSIDIAATFVGQQLNATFDFNGVIFLDFDGS